MINNDITHATSEYKQILKYINLKTNVAGRKQKNQNKVENVIKRNTIKGLFNLINFQDSDKLKLAIDNSLKIDISNELSIAKNFFICSDIFNCYTELFFRKNNYPYIIDNINLNYYKKYILNTTFRNIFLELFKFKKTNIIINYKNIIKDIIYGIQDNVLIDFKIYDNYSKKISLLKSFIYNLNNIEKIEIIKLIEFKKSFDDLNIIEFKFDTEYNYVNKINDFLKLIKKNVKPQAEITEYCHFCFFKNNCNIKNTENNKTDFNSSKQKIKKLKPIKENKHKFLI